MASQKDKIAEMIRCTPKKKRAALEAKLAQIIKKEAE